MDSMLCVIAKLDKRSTEKLTAIQKAAAPDAGLKPLYGHITLASYMGGDEAGFMAFCAALLKGVSRFAVKYTHLAVLEETSIVAALAEKAGTLAALHRSIAEEYGGSLNEWTSSDEAWLPHTTLLYDPQADLQAACCKMAADFAPFTAGIVGIEFSRVTPSGYEILGRVELCD